MLAVMKTFAAIITLATMITLTLITISTALFDYLSNICFIVTSKSSRSWHCCMCCNPANGRVDFEEWSAYKIQLHGIE